LEILGHLQYVEKSTREIGWFKTIDYFDKRQLLCYEGCISIPHISVTLLYNDTVASGGVYDSINILDSGRY